MVASKQIPSLGLELIWIMACLEKENEARLWIKGWFGVVSLFASSGSVLLLVLDLTVVLSQVHTTGS